MRKVNLETLRHMLACAKVREVEQSATNGPFERMAAREEVRKLKARIARREREETLRSLGLVKVRGNLGGTYWE